MYMKIHVGMYSFAHACIFINRLITTTNINVYLNKKGLIRYFKQLVCYLIYIFIFKNNLIHSTRFRSFNLFKTNTKTFNMGFDKYLSIDIEQVNTTLNYFL